LNNYQKLVNLSIFGVYVTLFINWAGVAALIRQPRAMSLLSFISAINLATLCKLYDKKIQATLSRRKIIGLIFPLCMVIIGFISNFGLPLAPVIKTDNESYVRVLPSQLGFSDYPLHSIMFLSLYQSSIPILRLRPFTTFGLTDLLWNVQKIPQSSDIIPPVASPEITIEIIQERVESARKRLETVIVPCMLREGALPGTVGYNSLYHKPYLFLLDNGKGILYNNGAYVLFLA